MKTAELTGKVLDYWVGRAAGYQARIRVNSDVAEILAPPAETRAIGDIWITYRPSERWDIGGPIIERERIQFTDIGDEYRAHTRDCSHGDGPVHLIAAMRAFVASKFGDTVPDEA